MNRDFGPADGGQVTFDRHYLLYASAGAMRLVAEGQSWWLPPARAAVIAAGAPITVTIPTRVTCCSVLFDPSVYPAPAQPLCVIEMTPLARSLILACRGFGPDGVALTPLARQMFDLLATLAAQMADRPSPAVMPTGRSQTVRAALDLTEARLGEAIHFDDVARAVGAGSRTLARRFADELGMSWADAQRRLRMIRAAELLSTSVEPVTGIALSVGYGSSSAFNAAFRAVMRCTPTEFRASVRGG